MPAIAPNENEKSSIFWILVATSFASCLVQLDLTIVNVALKAIQLALATDVTALQWVVDAYTLGFAVLLMSAGTMGDRFGSKRVFIAGFLILALASLACGVSGTVDVLSISRGGQGIGAALMLPSSLALLRRACADDQLRLAKALGVWSAVGGASLAAGPLLGGLLIEIGGWRAIFFINLPICFLGMYLAIRKIPTDHTGAMLREFDWGGQLVGIIVLLLIVSGIIELPRLGLSHPFVLICCTGGALGILLFIVIERRARFPLLPIHVFGSASFSTPVVFGVLINFSYCGLIFVFSLYLQDAKGLTPLAAGIAFLPLTATFVIGNLIGGRATARWGPGLPMVGGALVACIGYGLLFLLLAEGSVPVLIPALILVPAGMGTAIPGMMSAVLSSVNTGLAGTAMAVLNTGRQVGAALGVAVFGALIATGRGVDMLSVTRLASMISCAILLVSFLLLLRAFPPRSWRIKELWIVPRFSNKE